MIEAIDSEEYSNEYECCDKCKQITKSKDIVPNIDKNGYLVLICKSCLN